MKSKIAKFINKMGDDKKNHLIMFTLGYLSLEPFINIWALLITIIFAGLVEIYDKFSDKGEASFMDFIASIVLALLHTLLTLIYSNFF
jgi:hypothetical protein